MILIFLFEFHLRKLSCPLLSMMLKLDKASIVILLFGSFSKQFLIIFFIVSERFGYSGNSYSALLIFSYNSKRLSDSDSKGNLLYAKI